MKKILLSFLMLAAMTTASVAQDDAAASLKAAKKNIQRYREDPKDLKALTDARAAIDAAFKTDALTTDPKTAVKALMARADIYSELASADNTAAFLAQQTKQKFEAKYGDAAVQSVETYIKVLNNPNVGKTDKKDAIEYMSPVVMYATNSGLGFFNAQKYKDAYRAFNVALEAKKATKDAKDTKILDGAGAVEEIKYNAALSAVNGDMPKEAITLLEELRAVNYIQSKEGKNPAQIHSLLAGLYTKTGQKEQSIAVVGDGRKRYPEEQDLLLTEINYYITEGQLNKLEDRLEEAIKKDPKNVGLYTVKAKMYEGLAENYNKEGKTEDAAKAVENAKVNYTRALEQDPKSFDALYNMGAMAFNKAASITAEMNKLGMSKAEEIKYKELEAQMKKLFSDALPFFERAEGVKADDPSVIIALYKINDKLGNVEKAKLYKTRMGK
jgi:tetratricopeptide (TPR) repeat protein